MHWLIWFTLFLHLVDFNESIRKSEELKWAHAEQNSCDLNGTELISSLWARNLIAFDWLLHLFAQFCSEYTNTQIND